jgi:hypothetical protein
MSRRDRRTLRARLVKTRQALLAADLDDARTQAAVMALNALIGELVTYTTSS